MDKTYPIDSFGVKNIGVEKWLNDYYSPVNGKEIREIFEDVFHKYLSTIRKYDSKVVYWLAVSNLKTPKYVAACISSYLRLCRLKERGYEYVISQRKEEIPRNFSTYDYTSLPEFSIIDMNYSQQITGGRTKDIVRLISHNCSFSGVINKAFFKNISDQSFIVGNKHQSEVALFMKTNEVSPIYLPIMLFARNRSKANTFYSEIDQFVCDFMSLVKREYNIVHDSLFETLERLVNGCFRDSLLYFHDNLSAFKKLKHKTLYATSLGDRFHRLFCSAWRYSGGNVVGFVHGHCYCISYTPGQLADGLPIVNKFVVNSPGHERLTKQVTEDFSFGLEMASITHAPQSYYKPMFDDMQRAVSVKRIRKIMLIGFPMDDMIISNPWLPEHYTLAQLHLELRLVKLLKTVGYYVIYKTHPDRLKEAKGIFEDYADQVLIERFEDVCGLADCFLFGTPNTSTFGFALFTNKPIILVNIKGRTWYQPLFELLTKRCCIVDAEADESGRILFNRQDVIDAIDGSINNINYDILYEYAF